MGAAASRQATLTCAKCSAVVRPARQEAKDQSRLSDRDLPYRTLERSSPREAKDNDAASQGSGDRPQNLKRRSFSKKMNQDYQELSLEEPEAEGCEFDSMVEKGRCSAEMMEWAQGWLSVADQGELDIYTCWGLSNALTCSPDTRKVMPKVIAVTVLQLVIPAILLFMQVAGGFSVFPKMPSLPFRIMGTSLYLYSLYSMYNNALDECRSQLLSFAIDQRCVAGTWVPLLAGEFLNVFVSLILVVTLFVIFTGVMQPADLILNAVAVNFLGAVDGEFVNNELKNDAMTNFRKLFELYGNDLLEPQDKRHGHNKAINVIMSVFLTTIVVSGICFAILFLLAPSPDAATFEHQFGHRGVEEEARKLIAYPRLV